MSNIKKINGHSLKDEQARYDKDILQKQLDSLVNTISILEDELNSLEQYLQ